MNIFVKLLFFLAAYLFLNPLYAQDSLTVLTYNIEGMKPGTSPGFRLSHIISELKNIDPDIIALQEINQAVNGDDSSNQGMVITNALSAYFGISYYYYQKMTHLSWDNQFREYIGIISKYPVMEEGYAQLATGVFPRKVIWNYIETPLGKVNFFDTHLSFNSQSVRLQQVQQVNAYVAQIKGSNEAVINILCGDFNDIPSAPSITFLKEESGQPYVDSYMEVNPDMNGFTVPSNAPNARIDYIFSIDDALINVASSQTVMEGAFVENIYRSDHLGVLSVFRERSNAIEDTDEAPREKPFAIKQNYPNPYSSNSLIEYEIFEAGVVEISLFNVTGQVLEILENKKRKKGIYPINFDTSSYAGQIVFLKIELNGFFEILKLKVE